MGVCCLGALVLGWCLVGASGRAEAANCCSQPPNIRLRGPQRQTGSDSHFAPANREKTKNQTAALCCSSSIRRRETKKDSTPRTFLPLFLSLPSSCRQLTRQRQTRRFDNICPAPSLTLPLTFVTNPGLFLKVPRCLRCSLRAEPKTHPKPHRPVRKSPGPGLRFPNKAQTPVTHHHPTPLQHPNNQGWQAGCCCLVLCRDSRSRPRVTNVDESLTLTRPNAGCGTRHTRRP